MQTQIFVNEKVLKVAMIFPNGGVRVVSSTGGYDEVSHGNPVAWLESLGFVQVYPTVVPAPPKPAVTVKPPAVAVKR